MIKLATILVCIVTLLIGYACGNIHGAYLIGKIFKDTDIREHGSKNSGTTNALRVFGLKYAIPVFIIDFSKAYLPVIYVQNVLTTIGFSLENYNADVIDVLKIIAAIGVVLGHNYPIVLNFRGGKGIACTLGILTALNPWCGLIACVTLATVIIITRYVSLASIITVATAPLSIYLITKNVYFIFLGFFVAVMGIYRHKENIDRLKKGTERKFGEKVGEKK